MSHPARGAWIEILKGRQFDGFAASHPARGAWIEILNKVRYLYGDKVAPRKGCVD